MNTTQISANNEPALSPLKPALQFSSTLLKANLRNWKAMAITMALPLIMLLSFWLPAMAGDEESQELMQLLFPAIIILSVIMPGLTQATRLTRWREQNSFKRFALTPVPLSSLMVGAALTQIVIGIGQGILILLFGVFVIGLELALGNVLLVLGGMVLAGATFIAYGSLIAAFSKKSDIAGYVFFFTIMPLTFLASFPSDMMPDAINAFTPWLPTAMAIEIVGPLFASNQLSDGALLAFVGLLIYTGIFIAISVRRFRS
jgi:ABC-type multidrug transport system permease subunit